MASLGQAQAFQDLGMASQGLAWTSQGLNRACQGLARASLGLAWASLGLAQASGGAEGWTDGRNFSPFYRTSSPIGAAAEKYKHLDQLLASSPWNKNVSVEL